LDWFGTIAEFFMWLWRWSGDQNHFPLVPLVFLAFWLGTSVLSSLGRLMRDPEWEKLALYLLDPLAKWLIFGFGVALYLLLVAWPQQVDLGRVIDRLGLSLNVDWRLVTIASVILLMVWIGIALFFYWLARSAGARLDRRVSILQPRTTAETTAFVLVLSPTAGILEEIVFRGLLFVMFLGFNPDPWNAALWTSVLFAMGHAYQGLGGILATGIMGYTAAVSVIWTGTLWPAIIAHTIYDMATVIIYKRLPEWPREWEYYDPKRADDPFGV
jgi:membrane protease YdiL (CAAX protease family)